MSNRTWIGNLQDRLKVAGAVYVGTNSGHQKWRLGRSMVILPASGRKSSDAKFFTRHVERVLEREAQ